MNFEKGSVLRTGGATLNLSPTTTLKVVERGSLEGSSLYRDSNGGFVGFVNPPARFMVGYIDDHSDHRTTVDTCMLTVIYGDQESNNIYIYTSIYILTVFNFIYSNSTHSTQVLWHLRELGL